MRRHIIAAPLLIGVCVSAAAAQDTTRANTPDPAAAQLSDSVVLARMHATNQHEIRLGHLAQRNGSAQQVKSLGARLVRDHSAADERVTALADKLDIKLAGKAMHDQKGQMRDQRTPMADTTARGRDTTHRLQRDTTYGQRDTTGQGERMDWARDQQGKPQTQADREHAQVEKRLQSLRGAAFDSAFARVVVQGHERTIAMLQQAQQQVENEELKSLIASTLPTVREHHRIAQQLASGAVTTTSER